ncbi:hypothetical protein FRZ40_13265 [Paraburkholderia azotifigens]|uniref:Uncharacterized protein n=1 Tax=Paraburkholderia azotifigens TaxID=2057004 RepID=A0A5C6VYD7_9BURK|nr:hypothetical protein FRZ40_13265 [Paraburkholderia azotifigens]
MAARATRPSRNFGRPYTSDDKAVEFTKTYCINDYYDFVVELKRYARATKVRLATERLTLH